VAAIFLSFYYEKVSSHVRRKEKGNWN